MKLPRAIAEKIARTKSQFRVDYFRSGGPGGQNQNKVSSGVRITDLVTGIAVRCTDTPDQHKNKSLAFFRLVDKLIAFYTEEEKKGVEASPETTVRSYKVKGDSVTDHRLVDKRFSYERVLEGELAPIHTALKEAELDEQV